MTSSEITRLRKEGHHKEAYRLAKQALDADKENIWNKRNLAWVLYDFLKQATKKNKTDDALKILKEMEKVNLPDTEKMLFEGLGWQTGKLIYHNARLTGQQLDEFFKVLSAFPFPRPAASYTFLAKAFTKHSSQWKGYYDFVKWWGLNNFITDDYQTVKLENGKKILSDAERIYIAISKSLLQPPVVLKKAEAFIPEISSLAKEHPEMQYPPFYLAKLLLVTGNKKEFLKAFIPFARKKKRDFWVWDLMSEVFGKNDPKYFACLCRSLDCGAPVKFSLNVKEKFAALLIEKGMLREAKCEIDEVLSYRKKENWRLTNNLKKWQADKNLQAIIPPKTNTGFYRKHASEADKLLFFDIKPEIIVIENIRREKQVAYFVATKEKYGSFLYRHFDIKIKAGDIFSVRFLAQNSGKSPDFYKLATIDATDEKPSEDIYKTVSGNLKIKPGNSFGFVENVFVPPALISGNRLVNGQKIALVALLSFNKKKKTWGWKAVNLGNSPIFYD